MVKVLVTGSDGQLGRSLRKAFASDENIEPYFTDYNELDITDRNAVNDFFHDNKVDYVVNCAAYTAVDKAETDDLKASLLNTGAVGIIAQAAAQHNVKVIHVSTDYVFSGESFRPYNENDEPFPQSIYGRTKLEGEGMLTSLCPGSIIIRTAWLYSEFGNNFVKTMLRLSDSHDTISVVSDQIGTPTYAGDLADAIHAIISNPEWHPGIYHFTDEGVASWYDFAKSIFKESGRNVKVLPIPSSEYPTPAKRPLYSVLNKNKIKRTYGIEIPYWQDSLKKCMTLLEQQG